VNSGGFRYSDHTGESTKAEIISKLIDAVPVVLILLGVILLTLGLAGGVTYQSWLPIPDLTARIVAGVTGVLMCGLGVFQGSKSTGIPNAAKFGIKITYPVEGEKVERTSVRGTIKRQIPKDYVLKVLRVYTDHGFVPVGEAIISLEKGTWEAHGCHVGGKPGEPRWLAACLVGPGGMALFDYHQRAALAHNPVRDRLQDLTKKEEMSLPTIKKKTPDIIECDRVGVWRI
jgi:hypothetical protein